jgi:kumamolisin
LEDRLEVTVMLRAGPLPEADKRGLRIAGKIRKLEEALPADRRRLTEAELSTYHGPDRKHIKMVEDFARQFELDVVRVAPVLREVVLAGPVRQLNKAFRVRLGQFHHHSGICRAHKEDVHLPAALAAVVESVLGLDDVPVVRPSFARGRSGARGRSAKLLPVPDLTEAYRFPPGATGRGRTVAILCFGGGYHDSDIEHYFRTMLKRPVPRIESFPVNGITNQPYAKGPLKDFVAALNDSAMSWAALEKKFTDWATVLATTEVTMDIQIIGAAAPGARIAVYFAPPTALGIRRAITAALGRGPDGAPVRGRRPADVISLSWGQAEQDWRSQDMRAIDAALMLAKTHNVPVCVATGDFGSADPLGTKIAGVEFPASSPEVLACGGTRGPSDAVYKEVWHGSPTASGGGYSGFFARPSYQDALYTPSTSSIPAWVSPQHEETHSFIGRGLPDVAASATGYEIYCGGLRTEGNGTSAATPLWAALLAVIGEALGARVGFLNNLLYTGRLSAGFNAVTSGNNETDPAVAFFKAKPGWDPCTGWGTPDGGKLTALLRGKLRGS